MELNKAESSKRKPTEDGSSTQQRQEDIKKRQRPNTTKFVRHFSEDIVKHVDRSSMHEQLNSDSTTENVIRASITHKGNKDFDILVEGDNISSALAVVLEIDICPNTCRINEGTSSKPDVTKTSLEPYNPMSLLKNSPAITAHISGMRNKLPVLDLNQEATDASRVPRSPMNLPPTSPVRTHISRNRNKLRVLDLNQILEDIV